MSKENVRDRGVCAVSSGVLSDLSAAFGGGQDFGQDAPEPTTTNNPPRLIGRGHNRRTREPDEPRFGANHRSNRAGSGRT